MRTSFLNCKRSCAVLIAMCILLSVRCGAAELELIDVWPNQAPGETTSNAGSELPRRASENPPATRVTGITKPLLEVHLAPPDKNTGTAVIICPGGGYNYVVRDKEGAEVAKWLNELGVNAFVLRYRTKQAETTGDQLWQRPLQDAQRSVSLVRSRAGKWAIHTNRVGIMGFSAGGHLAALTATRYSQREYSAIDELDSQSCRPDFAMLIYPWRLWDEKNRKLSAEVTVTSDTPPTFLVHAHDDSVTPLSSVHFYAALKENRVPAEIHIYQSGGHGYGIRPVEGTRVATWPQRAHDWFLVRGLLERPQDAASSPQSDAAENGSGSGKSQQTSVVVKELILPGESFLLAERPAFIMWPPPPQRRTPQPWVFYAPTLRGLPDAHEKWMMERLLAKGIAIAGIDVGEAYGGPEGRRLFSLFYDEVTKNRGLGPKPCLLGRSRGGLWVTSWAAENTDKVAGIAGIYPVFDLRSYPKIEKAAPAYGLSAEQLTAQLADHNPIEKVGKLAAAKIPVFLIHGDEDKIVPLEDNSAAFVARYRAAAAPDLITLEVAKGQGHNYWEGFFRSEALIRFVERSVTAR